VRKSRVLTSLEREIADIIVECTGIEPLELDVLDPEQLLFNGEMGLDSIDALEIVMALQEKYGVRIDDKNQSRFILKSITTISEFISKNRKN